MRAAYLTELGGPDVIQVGELPEPRPGPTDVRVYRTPIPMPFVVGRDMVGGGRRAGVDQRPRPRRPAGTDRGVRGGPWREPAEDPLLVVPL